MIRPVTPEWVVPSAVGLTLAAAAVIGGGYAEWPIALVTVLYVLAFAIAVGVGVYMQHRTDGGR
jgi:ABC-type transport system involved in cytochrome bd biosynthesis fused ATPase/permease subunit